MVTEISGAGPGYPVVSQTFATGVQRPGGGIASDQAASIASGSDIRNQAPEPTQVAGAFAQLQDRQHVVQKAAATVRQVGSSVENASELLGKVEQKLDQIVKMFPPYPIDSPIRISLLNKIDGLRKQIEQITFPPPEAVDGIGKVLGNSRSEASAMIAAGRGQLSNLPELNPTSASDTEVSSALELVKNTRASLQGMQAGMWQDVVDYVQQAGSPETRAAGVRDQLAGLNGLGIGSDAVQLARAAESQ